MDFVVPLTRIIVSLYDSISTRVSHFVNLDERVHSIKSELKKLTDKRDDLKREVDQVETDGFMCTNQVKGWLERVEAIEVEVGSIIDDSIRRRRCFWSCNVDCSSRYKLGKKIPRKLAEISEMRTEADSVVVVVRADGSLPPPVENIPNCPTFGLEVMLDKVQQVLRDDEVGRIGMYGMGGAGKTTLLKSINNEFLTNIHDFDVVIWVVVSKDFVTEKIQQAVGARLGLSWVETESQEQRAMKIHRIMMRKKFLLLLDDVWEGLDLLKIGIPLPDKKNKCKLIFMTRSMDVCSDMDAHQMLEVEFLKEQESWQLFSEKVGGRRKILDSPYIQPHAKAIIKKCGGQPLALITMGRAMANKQTVQEWKHAVEVINSSLSEVRGMENVFDPLKFSFDSLDNDTLRSCFLYCSLFPEDYSIEKEQLVEYWIGEGFLETSNDSNAHNKGYAVIGDLRVACLLEDGEEKTQVKMHNVVRSFALWIASDFNKNNKKYLVHASAGRIEAPGVENWVEAQKISLLDNKFTELPVIPVCPNLSTLLLQQNVALIRIHDGFFQHMPVLRVLDLSSSGISDVPASINSLVELCHLDLSGTKVSSLPRELGGLVKLQHLDLQRTYFLRMIPREAISGLTQLRVLNMYYSYGHWEIKDLDIPVSEGDDGIRFADLECLKRLTSLGITITEFTTLNMLSGITTLQKCLQYLNIKDCEGLIYAQLLTESSDGKILRRLSITNCHDLKYFVIGEEAGNRWLPSLEVLALHGLPKLVTLWRTPVTQECLRNLRSISIQHCHKLKNVSWALRLLKVEEIYLFHCDEMEEMVSDDVMVVGDSTEFSSLKILEIRYLPKLRSISQVALAFPSLEKIVVSNCPKLKKLPFGAHSDSTLPMVYGDKEWSDALEWDDALHQSCFPPPFRVNLIDSVLGVKAPSPDLDD